MILALIVGASIAVALFVISLFLAPSIGLAYDSSVIALFRWIGRAGALTLFGCGAYAVFVTG